MKMVHDGVKPSTTEDDDHQLVARVVIEDLTYAGGNAKQMLPINQLSMANLDESGIIDTDMLNYWELLFNQGNATEPMPGNYYLFRK